MVKAYKLRHILQTLHPLSFWVAVVIADIHVCYAVGDIVSMGWPDKIRQEVVYLG